MEEPPQIDRLSLVSRHLHNIVQTNWEKKHEDVKKQMPNMKIFRKNGRPFAKVKVSGEGEKELPMPTVAPPQYLLPIKKISVK